MNFRRIFLYASLIILFSALSLFLALRARPAEVPLPDGSKLILAGIVHNGTNHLAPGNPLKHLLDRLSFAFLRRRIFPTASDEIVCTSDSPSEVFLVLSHISSEQEAESFQKNYSIHKRYSDGAIGRQLSLQCLALPPVTNVFLFRPRGFSFGKANVDPRSLSRPLSVWSINAPDEPRIYFRIYKNGVDARNGPAAEFSLPNPLYKKTSK